MASNASLRSRKISPLIFLGLISAGIVLPAQPATAAPSCSSFSVGVYDRVNPTTQVQGITRSWTESREYANNGFTHSRGVPFKVATSSGASLGAVHRLYRPSSGNLFYSLDAAEISRATSSLGYVDQGIVFYAGTSAASCLLPVTDYYRAGKHRFVTSSAEGASLAANGWVKTRVRFYVGKPPSDPKFAIAVMPDTQQEVLTANDGRFLNRTQWLASNKTSLDLRYVTHDGDVVNWDTPDHIQYIRAQSAMKVLKDNRIPFSLTVGNHDTAAVCPGGGACAGADASITVRDTTSFNRYLAAGVDNLGGRYESGKVDNMYSTFEAGGLQWLVLNLELWPRPAVITWAKRVVATHPRHNVAIATHSYLTSSGAISGSNGGYGATSPQYLYDNLVKVYPNVRLMFSGHTGTSAYRVDTGTQGNKIYSMLLTMHDQQTNPLRLVDIDTAANTLSTRVYAPYTNLAYPAYNKTYTGVSWVR